MCNFNNNKAKNNMSSEQYDNVCKEEFQKITKGIQELNKRLYQDNGVKSIQTKINELENWQLNYDNGIRSVNNLNDLGGWLLGNWKTVLVIIMIAGYMIVQLLTLTGFTPQQQDELIKILEKVMETK